MHTNTDNFMGHYVHYINIKKTFEPANRLSYSLKSIFMFFVHTYMDVEYVS